uniref:Uncharacterized protein n=1 Tax=Myotis myotis TaxID=51298 RepID=A0A7J7T6G6_MYOMY|nr:hypothetical protein mMyoMyo1_009139 [Myotis myotis]
MQEPNYLLRAARPLGLRGAEQESAVSVHSFTNVRWALTRPCTDSPRYREHKGGQNALPAPPRTVVFVPHAAPSTQSQRVVPSPSIHPGFLRASVSLCRNPRGSGEGGWPHRPRCEAYGRRRAVHVSTCWARGRLRGPPSGTPTQSRPLAWVCRSRRPAKAPAPSAPTRKANGR